MESFCRGKSWPAVAGVGCNSSIHAGGTPAATVWVFRHSESSKSVPGDFLACFARLQHNTKKNELAQNICASSIQYSICVAGYCTWKPPGPPRLPCCQPFPSFKLNGSLPVRACHHTAVVPFWDAADEVVTTTQ